jgi:hypothetical protein
MALMTEGAGLWTFQPTQWATEVLQIRDVRAAAAARCAGLGANVPTSPGQVGAALG